MWMCPFFNYHQFWIWIYYLFFTLLISFSFNIKSIFSSSMLFFIFKLAIWHDIDLLHQFSFINLLILRDEFFIFLFVFVLFLIFLHVYLAFCILFIYRFHHKLGNIDGSFLSNCRSELFYTQNDMKFDWYFKIPP